MAVREFSWGHIRCTQLNSALMQSFSLKVTKQGQGMGVKLKLRRSLLERVFVIGGVLFVSSQSAVAQLQPIADDTLGNENSIVSPDEVIDNLPGNRINGGARRGANLFHSFQEFSIDEGRAAYFANPAGVENILGRVTGGGRSDILGQLGVLGTANLFLINPNGIVFGPNSSLDIGGSFVASTGDAIGFGEQGWFSATTPEAPSPLLTINPSAFFLNQIQTSPIIVQSTTTIDPTLESFGLSVGVGENLALLGGDINVEGGGLNAPGGRIDLGAVEGVGAIRLNVDGSFAFPAEVRRGDIVFTEGSRGDVRTPDSGGAMAITAQRITVTGESQLRAGILPGQGAQGSQAGDIVMNAAEQISMTQSSRIQNAVAPDSLGHAGNVQITTPILKVVDGARLDARTFGQGDAGSIIITASDHVTFQGESRDGGISAAFSTVVKGGDGDGGNVKITTPILEVLDGASLVASTFGQGDAGSVIITASDRVTFRGESRDGRFVSAAFSAVEESGNGDGGGIKIIAPILEVLDGAGLAAGTRGQGNAGSVIITASDRVTFRGESRDGRFVSTAFSRVEDSGEGNGGNIKITAPILELLDGAGLTASTFGRGDAGSVIINASERLLLYGVGSNGFPSGIFSSTSSNAPLRGRNVIVATPHLQIANGAVIKSGTTTAQAGGEIVLEADQVSAVGGGQVITSTSGDGQAGTIKINADLIHLSGRDPTFAQRLEEFGPAITENERDGESGLFANTRPDSRGDGGNIILNTIDLVIRNQAQITAQSRGAGAAGNVGIQAQSAILLDNHASINSDTNGGQGDIDLATDLLLLRDNSTITTNASGPATGGNIDIEADFIVAAPNENSDIFANALQGSGGQITLTALGIFGLEFRTRAELQQLLGDAPNNLTPRNLPSNDVTAFSQANPNLDVGTVIFRTPDVDPSRGLTQLPVDLTDASQLIAQTCPTGNAAANQANEFIVTGRGGLPPTPSEAINQPAIQVELVTAVAAEPIISHHESIPHRPPLSSASTPTSPIVEAQGFLVAADGTVSLVAAAPVHAVPSLNRPIHCQ